MTIRNDLRYVRTGGRTPPSSEPVAVFMCPGDDFFFFLQDFGPTVYEIRFLTLVRSRIYANVILSRKIRVGWLGGVTRRIVFYSHKYSVRYPYKSYTRSHRRAIRYYAGDSGSRFGRKSNARRTVWPSKA